MRTPTWHLLATGHYIAIIIIYCWCQGFASMHRGRHLIYPRGITSSDVSPLQSFGRDTICNLRPSKLAAKLLPSPVEQCTWPENDRAVGTTSRAVRINLADDLWNFSPCLGASLSTTRSMLDLEYPSKRNVLVARVSELLRQMINWET